MLPPGAVGIRYTTVKITIQTMSTKCQYRPTISTGNAGSSGSRSANDIPMSDSSMKMPTVTCTPWKPGQHEERGAEQVGVDRQPLAGRRAVNS